MAGIAALAVAYVLSQFFRSFLAVLAPVLAGELGATKTDLALASGAWFATFALMQFVVGVGLDRFGPKRTASLLLGVAGGGGAALFAAATAPWMVTLAMALIGVGCAPVLMASLYIFGRIFSPRRFALLGSWFVAVGMAGNVIGASPLAYAAEWWGWRNVMWGLTAATLVVAVIILLATRDPEPVEQAASGKPSSTGFGGYLELIRMPVLWPLIPLMLVSYSTVAGIRGLWAGPYLADMHGADVVMIGQATLWMALAMVAGTFLYGPMDTLFGTRKWVVFAGNAGMLAAVAALAVAPAMPTANAVAVLVALGLFGTSYSVIMAHARAFYPPHLLGRGVTLMNAFGIGGVGLLQPLSGAVLTSAASSWGLSQSYRLLFGFYAVILAAALVVFLFSRDARPETA